MLISQRTKAPQGLSINQPCGRLQRLRRERSVQRLCRFTSCAHPLRDRKRRGQHMRNKIARKSKNSRRYKYRMGRRWLQGEGEGPSAAQWKGRRERRGKENSVGSSFFHQLFWFHQRRLSKSSSVERGFSRRDAHSRQRHHAFSNLWKSAITAWKPAHRAYAHHSFTRWPPFLCGSIPTINIKYIYDRKGSDVSYISAFCETYHAIKVDTLKTRIT